MKFIQFVLWTLIISASAHAWQVPSQSIWCGEVAKLLNSKGLVTSVSIPNQPLLPGEIIEPQISISNKSNLGMLVPDPDPTKQISIDVHRRVDNVDPLKAYHMHSLMRANPADSGDQSCRMKTRMLAPGMTLEINKAQYGEQAVLSYDFTSQVPRADARPGKHKFSIYLGDFEYSGFYDVSPVKLLSYYCLPMQSRDPVLAASRINSCVFVQNIFAEGKYFIAMETIANETGLQRRRAKELDQLIQVEVLPNQNGNSARSQLRGQRLRIATFDTAIEFGAGDRFPAVADPDQLQIFNGGRRLKLSEFFETISMSRREKMRSKVTSLKDTK